jgi:hypothetical protein
MCPIGRRVIALATAYAVALNLILPLVVAFASASDAAAMTSICATDRLSRGLATDLPDRHPSICPLGMACAMPDCGATALPAGSSVSAVASAGMSRPSLAQGDEQAHRQRNAGGQFARAPPRA